MSKPKLTIEREFDLMVKYQVAIESQSVIVKNDETDRNQFSLYTIAEPYPSYEEYLNGNDFEEESLIKNSSSLTELQSIQEERRKVKELV